MGPLAPTNIERNVVNAPATTLPDGEVSRCFGLTPHTTSNKNTAIAS